MAVHFKKEKDQAAIFEFFLKIIHNESILSLFINKSII